MSTVELTVFQHFLVIEQNIPAVEKEPNQQNVAVPEIKWLQRFVYNYMYKSEQHSFTLTLHC